VRSRQPLVVNHKIAGQAGHAPNPARLLSVPPSLYVAAKAAQPPPKPSPCKNTNILAVGEGCLALAGRRNPTDLAHTGPPRGKVLPATQATRCAHASVSRSKTPPASGPEHKHRPPTASGCAFVRTLRLQRACSGALRPSLRCGRSNEKRSMKRNAHSPLPTGPNNGPLSGWRRAGSTAN
jgi:hypothetical protein